jgi:uracil-DNA glycosylase
VDPSWKDRLSGEFVKPYFMNLVDFVRAERQKHVVFPAAGDVFNAFKVTPFDKANVLILGQDPYHNAGQAHGLCFSVLPGMKPPPSLLNIYKELASDVGFQPPKHGFLMPWAERGVFLLNATLTVRAHEPGSHQGKGWETFTDAAIRALNDRPTPVVFVLWGRYARQKADLIDKSRHTVIESAHPSPMSASSGFFGSRPFSKINEALGGFGLSPIDWSLLGV